MQIDANDIKKKLSRLWETSKKDFEHMTADASRLVKLGEKHLKVASQQSQKKMELINATLKREKAYYLLGKAAASSGKKSKVISLKKEISKLTKEIKKLNK
jgi:hypothetical protein